MFRDDPSFEEFVAEVNQYRATRNQMPRLVLWHYDLDDVS